MTRFGLYGLAALLLLVSALSAQQQVDEEDAPGVDDRSFAIPDDLTLRARVLAIEPAEPVAIKWRYGGEGLGGEVQRGVVAERVELGQWSEPLTVRSTLRNPRVSPRVLYLTLTVGRDGRSSPGPLENRTRIDYSSHLRMEVEFTLGQQVVKTLALTSDDGGTVTLIIPARRAADGLTSDGQVWTDALVGVREHAQRRLDFLRSLPWADRPVPQKLFVVSTLGGYGIGNGYRIRHNDRQVIELEAMAMRQIGMGPLNNPHRRVAYHRL